MEMPKLPMRYIGGDVKYQRDVLVEMPKPHCDFTTLGTYVV